LINKKSQPFFWLTFICAHLVDVNETNYEMGLCFAPSKV